MQHTYTQAGQAPSAGVPPTVLRPESPAPSLSAEQVVELQGALGFLHDVAAAALRRIYDYLERNMSAYPELDDCLTASLDAARAFEVLDYGQALDHIHRAYRAVASVRATSRDLPPLSGLADLTPDH